MTVYLDVLVLLNLFVTWFLLLSVRKLLGISKKTGRMLLAAFLGGIYSLVMLLPRSAGGFLAAGKLVMAGILVAAAFGFGGFWVWCKRVLVFYLVNFVYGGFMFALWYFVTPVGMTFQNGVAYFHISALTLAASTVAAYLVLLVIGYFYKNRVEQKELVQLKIAFAGREILLDALVDTGNRLIDVITGLPVAVCEMEAAKSLFPDSVYEQLHNGALDQMTLSSYRSRFWLIPVRSVSGSGMVVGFRPERISVDGKEINAVVGLSAQKLSQGEFSALIGSEMK